MTAKRDFIAAIQEALTPDPWIRVSEWAAGKRILPKDSPEPGPWRNDRTPYLVEIMDSLSARHEKACREVYLMKGHQLGGSAGGENFIGSSICYAAGNVLGVFATLDDAEKWELNRFEPMRESTPELRRRILDANIKGADNTKKRKKFPGGMLQLVGANRPGALKSTTFRYVLLEEMDEYQGDIGNQGKPEDLARNRTSNFGNKARIFGNSTPTIKGASPIERNFLRGDQRKYFIPCPCCDHKQVLVWKNFKWPKGKPEEVGYACEACGAISSEREWKVTGLSAGQWKATAVGERGVRSYHLPSFYAPLGWRPWVTLAAEFEDGHKDPVTLKKIVNNEWAECWEDQSNGMDGESIQKRADSFQVRTIPKGCLILVMSVDVQAYRLEYKILGIGRNKRHWVIDYGMIDGNPARSEVWQELTDLRNRPIENEFGCSMRPITCAIDSGGHHTHEVYNYARLNRHQGVFAVKGHSQKKKGILSSKPSPQDISMGGQTIKSGAQLWFVGTDTAKDQLFGYLASDEESHPDERFINFPSGLSSDYYRQLTSEVFDERKGLYVKKIGRRNEVIDLFVYCFAAAHHPLVRIDAMRDSNWVDLEQKFEPKNLDLLTDGLQAEPDVAQPVNVEMPEVQSQPKPRAHDDDLVMAGDDYFAGYNIDY